LAELVYDLAEGLRRLAEDPPADMPRALRALATEAEEETFAVLNDPATPAPGSS
jgi:hypothetical protein